MGLVIEARSDAVKSNIAIRTWNVRSMNQGNWKWSRDGKGEHRHSRNRRTKMDWNWVNLTQMTITSTTAGRNPSEEMEYPSWSEKESEMQYLDRVSKTTD